MTNDYGEHWTLLTDGTNGIPADQPMHVVREDPEQEGLLYAGTLQGAYVSFDQGKHWQTLQQNLPATPVTDFKVHHGDLARVDDGAVVLDHGRRRAAAADCGERDETDADAADRRRGRAGRAGARWCRPAVRPAGDVALASHAVDADTPDAARTPPRQPERRRRRLQPLRRARRSSRSTARACSSSRRRRRIASHYQPLIGRVRRSRNIRRRARASTTTSRRRRVR